MLAWHSVPYKGERFFVKGTVLAQAVIPGTGYRFVVREVRGGRDGDGNPTLRYCVADAALVSDADVRAGKNPPAVFWADEPEICVKWALTIGMDR